MPQLASHHLLQRLRQQVVAHYGEAWFLREWPWPNPDAGHLRLKLPSGGASSGWPRRRVDLRIRPARLLAGGELPDELFGEVTNAACWTFDGAEQVAMTDFWILVPEADNSAPLAWVVLPTRVLLNALRCAAEPGRLCLFFTSWGGCFASPSLHTPLSALITKGSRIITSQHCLTRYLNAWHELADS